jgi:DNA invertase Pin-like site-specific DNA recombinase
MTTLRKCALYIRVSTEEQANKEHSSLETQDSLLRDEVVRRNKFAKEFGMDEEWQVTELYQDVISANLKYS